tara:strand:+ start:544 stop:1545 length:1002 start_codon:yes stop_codon:yes gene_type:complete
MEDKLNNVLFSELSEIIVEGKRTVARHLNGTLTLVYWQVGRRINTHILENERAPYAKEIVPTLSAQLTDIYGRSFAERNLRRMMQFAEVFPDIKIVSPLVTQLSWTHFITLLPIKDGNKRNYYADKASEEGWSKRQLQYQIERKAYERKEIAKSQIMLAPSNIENSFKDPYILDFLGIKDGYLEKDLESAIIKELELFIMELGKGFTFVERQKRMIIDGIDFHLDLLFYHRRLKRLVAIELKLENFKAAHKGQMELYLKWLNRYERQEGEEHPIGLILCSEKSNEQVELLEMGKDGIMVAEYWTELPSKDLLEAKLHSALIEARERITRKKLE